MTQIPAPRFRYIHRCVACDVQWTGYAGSRCWNCDQLGQTLQYLHRAGSTELIAIEGDELP